MKVWKRTLSAVMSICLVFSLFTGLDFVSAAAGTYGTLVNGALTTNTDGWTIADGVPLTTDSSATVGCGIQNLEDGGQVLGTHLSIWNNGDEEKTFSMTQTITKMEAGSYIARLKSVGNNKIKHNVVLRAHNDTKNTEVSVALDNEVWNKYEEFATTALEVAEGDAVTISISGPMTTGEWYGIHNVEFEAAAAEKADITVKKVPGLSEEFIHGVDVSTYLSEVQSGVTYKDENGVEKNMFEIFKDAGVNYVRFRVWNCPYRTDENGKILYTKEGNYENYDPETATEYNEDQVTAQKTWIISPDDAFQGAGYNRYFLADGTEVYREGYGAGNCDIDAAVEMGKIATHYGMKVLIDFHYSDFWADPEKMKCPEEWKGMDITAKATALSTYTTDCLTKLKNAGVNVGMVQVGNEINNGMAGEKDWANISKLLDAGTKAVRKFDSNIKIAIHYTDPNKDGYQMGKAKALKDAKIDYDVFASSYYSFWHGTPENLTNVLKKIAETYNKEVMVAEVSYCTTTGDGDGAANVVDKNMSPLNYSIDAQGEGQAAAVRDAIAAVAAVGEKGIGTFYWEPAWVPVKNYAGASADKKEEVLAYNIDKWQKYGSGWASMWSGPQGGGYDPGVDGDKSTHGSQWDNQAMFDFNGKALPSINVYKYVYTGTEGPVRPATIEQPEYSMNYRGTPQLPATVDVNLNDGRVLEDIAVTWDAAQVEALKTADYGEYTIDGELASFAYESKGETITVPAGEQKTTCAVKITGTNVLPNGSFEEGEEGWVKTSSTNFKKTGAGGDAKDGNNFYDAWTEGATTDFRVLQTITGDKLPAEGKYMLFGYYQGTKVKGISEGTSGLAAIVKYKNGKTVVHKGGIEIPGTWKIFYQAKAKDIVINSNVESVTVVSRLIYTDGWVVVDDINLMKTDDLTDTEKAYQPSESNTYTLTIKDGDTVLKTETVEAGAATTATAPTKEGYVFDGWDLAADYVFSDLTVTAKWKKNDDTGNKKTYTVTFKDGDKVLKTEKVEEGNSATAPAAPTKAGYTFDGWDKAFNNVTADLTVNAKWKQNQGTGTQEQKYTVTFNVNGGKAIKTKTMSVTAGKTYGTLPKVTRKGYTFSGWYTAKSGGQKISSSTKVTITKNTTLYARWARVAKPGNVKKPTVKNSKKNTIKVTFKKVKGAQGYEIRYASKSSMKGAKKVSTKKTSATIKNKSILKKGRTCYVQVRAYKTDSAGSKVYSKSYSTKVKVKIKK